MEPGRADRLRCVRRRQLDAKRAGRWGCRWRLERGHFTNDDLVKFSRLSEDYDATITGRPGQNASQVAMAEGRAGASGALYTIELTPKPDAPVVWGRIVVQVTPDRIPRQVAYYDEKGSLVRTMTFEDVRDFDGHTVPAKVRVVPADKAGEFTDTNEDIDFDASIPPQTFTLQALKQ